MTISGYEWMLLVTALSLSRTLGVAGVGSAVVARLNRLRTVKILEIQPGPMAARAKAA